MITFLLEQVCACFARESEKEKENGNEKASERESNS